MNKSWKKKKKLDYGKIDWSESFGSSTEVPKPIIEFCKWIKSKDGKRLFVVYEVKIQEAL